MEAAIHCPSSSSSSPVHSFLCGHASQPSRTHQLFLKKRMQRSLPSASRLRALPLNHVLSIAAASPAQRGDISVLLPVSALLIFIYWIANFIVPELIVKDLQRDAKPDGETEVEQESTTDQSKNPSLPSKPVKKIKKSVAKKAFSRKS